MWKRKLETLNNQLKKARNFLYFCSNRIDEALVYINFTNETQAFLSYVRKYTVKWDDFMIRCSEQGV